MVDEQVLDKEFTIKLQKYMQNCQMVLVPASDYVILSKMKELLKQSGTVKNKGEIVETPWGMIEV